MSGNRGDAVGNRIITEDATGSGLGGEIGTANAVDVVRSASLSTPQAMLFVKASG